MHARGRWCSVKQHSVLTTSAVVGVPHRRPRYLRGFGDARWRRHGPPRVRVQS